MILLPSTRYMPKLYFFNHRAPLAREYSSTFFSPGITGQVGFSVHVNRFAVLPSIPPEAMGNTNLLLHLRLHPWGKSTHGATA